MLEKRRYSLVVKLTILLIIFAISLSAAIILLGYTTFRTEIEQNRARDGLELAKIIATMVGAEDADRYLETEVIDAEYIEKHTLLKQLKQGNEIEFLYVFSPTEEGMKYIYNTNEVDDITLGTTVEWYGYLEEYVHHFLGGEEEIPSMVSFGEYGWILSVFAPIQTADGDVIAYAAVDYDMEKAIKERRIFVASLVLLTVTVTSIFCIIYFLFFKKNLISPINQIVTAVDHFLAESERDEPGVESSLSKLNIRTHDEIETLAEALISMETKINNYVHSLNVATQKAETDDLTGLLNREAFSERIKAALYAEEKMGRIHVFIMIDLDNFKQVNDNYGHVMGDQVLINVADALKKTFRSGDYVSRMGGDEFAVFCRNIPSIKIIQNKLEGLLENISDMKKELGLDTAGISTTISIGVAVYPHDATSISALYRKADEALYTVKSNGRNGIAFYGDIKCE